MIAECDQHCEFGDNEPRVIDWCILTWIFKLTTGNDLEILFDEIQFVNNSWPFYWIQSSQDEIDRVWVILIGCGEGSVAKVFSLEIFLVDACIVFIIVQGKGHLIFTLGVATSVNNPPL